MYAVHYISCFGQPEVATNLSRHYAYSLVSYLKSHPVARPVCVLRVRLKGTRLQQKRIDS